MQGSRGRVALRDPGGPGLHRRGCLHLAGRRQLLKWGTQEWLMRLSLLSAQLRREETDAKRPPLPVLQKPVLTPAERKQTVIGGEISRDPINKQAALLL